MKALLFSFFALLCILFSCQPSPKAQDGGEEDAQEEFVDTTPKATAIFWIDKHKEMPGQSSKRPGAVRTVKAKVNIHLAGRIEVLSYVKPQKGYIKSYINRRLETFRVRKVLMDSAYIKPGIQYVQLRYTPETVEH